MARLLFLSSVVCSFCFLATLVRCRQITGAPSESARSKNEPMPLQRVNERSYRDGLFRPTRVRVRRAAASSSDKTQVVGEVLPNSESTLIETHAIADPPPPPPATTMPPSQRFLTTITTFPPAVAGIILLNEATAPQPPHVTTPPPPLHPAAAAATLLPVAANTLRIVSTTKSTTSTTSTNTTTIPHPAAATTPPPLRLATTPPISPATTPPPLPLAPHPPADRAGKVKPGTNYAVLKESPAKEFPFAVEARLMSNSAYAALPGAVVPGAALPSAIASGAVVQSAVGPGAAVPGAVVAAYDVATPADTAAEELGKYRKVLPTKKPVRGASKQVLWPDSSAPVAPVAPAAPVAPVAPVATVAPAGKRVMSVNNPSGPVLYRNPVDTQLCAINPCKNDGICKIQPFGTSKIFCRCLPGFFGEYCQYDAPECQMDPCLNHGACHRSMSQPRGYECHCAYGYEGDNCEIAKVTAVAGGLLLADVVSDSFDSTASSDLTTTSAGPVVAPAAAAAAESTNRSLFVQMPFLAMVSVCALLLTLALYATIDTERKIVLERYTVLRAHGYDVEYPSAGYFGLALKKFVCLCCICCACCPCFDAMYLKVTEEQEPLPVLMKTGNIKGYTAVPQGYTAVPQGYTEVPQGYTAVPQGYTEVPQGYTAVPQGYTAMPQGYIAVPQSGDGVSSP